MATATYTQADRPLVLTTPLGPDKLLAVGLSGREGVSQLFRWDIDCRAERSTAVAFDRLLGQRVSLKLELPRKKGERFFTGVCAGVTQGETNRHFNHFQLKVVPPFWLLTRKAQSRIFQHVAVPDILRKVLTGLDVSFELRAAYEPRDYCVQYRETDFNFASRLMEEEGIYYFFKHSAGGVQMVVADTPGSHPDLTPASPVKFKTATQGAALDEGVIHALSKTQEVTSGKFTLWDHTFELPHKHLEADKPITPTVQAGRVSHPLKFGENGKLEIYDWPGEYAQRFDGVNRGGGDQPAELQKIFQDNKRTVNLRMEAAAAGAVVLSGASNCRHLTTGCKLSVEAVDDECKAMGADGPYVLTTVTHTARMGADYRSGTAAPFEYHNTFTLMPAGVPFRPPRTTPKPVVAGTQSAVVVGPKGEEIFTDRYGRVKVQFHWDREGKSDADSSCWVRVTQPWAGKRWGAFFIPRIGQELIIDFLEGDPDQPIAIGCVYNPDQMHPYLGDGPDTGNRSNHKQDPKLCGVKSNTTPGGVGFNEWRFDDTRGKEQVFVHAERDHDLRVKNDRRELVLHDAHLIVGAEKDGKKVGDQKEEVFQNKHLKVHKDQEEHIGGDFKLKVGGVDGGKGNVDALIGGKKTETIGGGYDLHVKSKLLAKVDDKYELTCQDRFVATASDDQLHVKRLRTVKVDQEDHLIVGTDKHQKVGGNYATEAGVIHLKAGQTVVIEAGAQLSLKVGGSFIDVSASGVAISGPQVLINSGGAPADGPGASPSAPNDPKAPGDAAEAKPVKPDVADDALTGQKSCP
ncbi:MAG TPA: type VI secretion system tip protein TssI/VgrG [Gemmataceae bacterium]|jgi:type VI secretion system secreted protein VgrG